ncbi:hypothetical protein [Halomontanus rarus]|uniref:hypothetical protein n=1 Tax=Halomontanus rarus TaxID=3034020 RepID=UPI00307C8962
MPLPDPETTDAEAIVVPEADVLEKIPDDNPFKETLVELRENGDDWGALEKALRAVYNPIDKAAYEESFIKIPEYEVRAVVHDEQSTSGGRYETFTCLAATEAEATERTEERHDVRRVESVEIIGMEKVS